MFKHFNVTVDASEVIDRIDDIKRAIESMGKLLRGRESNLPLQQKI